MLTPIANADSLRIGSVDFVSPDEIKVMLDIEAPNDVALNSGVPRPFPRVNSYVLIPCESGLLVSQIEWITVEMSQYPKRRGIQDFGILDLPYPLRKMSLNPLGILKECMDEKTKETKYTFSRGVEVFPTVGDPVLLPTQSQLRSIVESGTNRRVDIGVSPLAGNAIVSVDPDRLFSRHLAVLGNTGSGKSCSVAGIIRWSIESAQRVSENGSKTNARFIILDPNGEYAETFSDMSNVHIYGVESNEHRNIKQLKVPVWLWNTDEWVAFTQASSKTQRPTLVQALRTVRSGYDEATDVPSIDMRRYLGTILQAMQIDYNIGAPWTNSGRAKGLRDRVKNWLDDLLINDRFTQDEEDAITTLRTTISHFLGSNTTHNEEWPLYTKQSTRNIIEAIRKAYHIFGGKFEDLLPMDANLPCPFSGDALLRSVEANAVIMRTSEYVETMLMRIRTLLSDTKLKRVIAYDEQLSLEEWLDKYICPSDGSIVVIDLSLIPAELTHIITAVMARMTLETLQRYRKLNAGQTLPVTLVMEEAHTFIKRYNPDNESVTAADMCAKTFEKIAREGRKFGLGLVLSSQRPSELSPTVLSQCNSFLLHRISNDRDQELVSKLVPDNLRGLLRELPLLPSQNAILLGWASELPVMVQMNYLKKEHRPQSNDPEYWNTWTKEANIVSPECIKNIVDDWQKADTPESFENDQGDSIPEESENNGLPF